MLDGRWTSWSVFLKGNYRGWRTLAVHCAGRTLMISFVILDEAAEQHHQRQMKNVP